MKFSGNYQIKYETTDLHSNENTKDVFIKTRIIDDLGNEHGATTTSAYTFDRNTYLTDTITIEVESQEMTFLSARQYKIEIACEVQQKNVSMLFHLYEYKTIVQNPIGISNLGAFPHFMEFTPVPKIAFGTPLDFTKIFKMKVSDVLKDILNMNCIIVQTNNYTKNVQFNKFNDLIINKSIAKDWSNKIQFNKTMGFKFGNYARRNNLKFKTDSYENGVIWLSDETLDVEKDMVKLNHDPTFQYKRLNAYKIPTIDGLKDVNNEWLSPTYRLLQLKIQSTSFWINYTDGVTTTALNDFVPFCEFYNFDRLIEDNYGTITDILKSTKILKVIANLDITDISDLDFSIPIQIQRPDLNLSGYFYINKIENYKGGLTSCEIIEI